MLSVWGGREGDPRERERGRKGEREEQREGEERKNRAAAVGWMEGTVGGRLGWSGPVSRRERETGGD